jgi:hypothetical protein
LAVPIFGFFLIEQNLWLKAYQTSCEKAIYFKIVLKWLRVGMSECGICRGGLAGGRRRLAASLYCLYNAVRRTAAALALLGG